MIEVKLDAKQSDLLKQLDSDVRACIASYILRHQNDFIDMKENIANAVLTVLGKTMCSFAGISLNHSNTPASEAKKNIMYMIEVELDREFQKRAEEVLQ